VVHAVRRAILEDDCVHMASAAEWVRAFHPDVHVVLEQGEVALSSQDRPEAALASVWTSALANERLLASQAQARAAIMDVLIR
jgi:hypothetical protein